MLRSLLVIAMVLVAANAFAAAENPFKDVPANHWAYASIQKAVEAKVIQGYEGLFHGKRNVTRYQLAEVVGKMLDKCGGAPAAAGDAGQVKQLENLVTEFADELALLNVKVGKLEEVCNKGAKAPVAEATPGVGGTVFTDRGNLHVGGIIKARYESRDSDDDLVEPGDKDDGKGFWVPETRLYLDHALTSDIKALVSWEMGAGGLEGYTGATDGAVGVAPGGLLDAKLTFKMPKSESYIDFGRFQPEIGYYGGKLSNQLEFAHYPLYLSVLGPGAGVGGAGLPGFGGGIWWDEGFTFNFQNKNKTGKFALGMFNGGAGTVNGLDADDEKAIYVGGKFFPKNSKFSGGLWYWAEDFGVAAPGVPMNDFTALGLWFKYAKPEKWSINLEYVMPEWSYGAASSLDSTDWLLGFRVPLQKEKTDIGIRYEKLDTDQVLAAGATANEIQWTRMTFGFRWLMDKNCHLSLDWEKDSYETVVPPAAATETEPSRVVLQAMYFF